jgi:hypothetical protein
LKLGVCESDCVDFALDEQAAGKFAEKVKIDLWALDRFLEKSDLKFYFGNLACFAVFRGKWLFSFGDNFCGRLGVGFSKDN